MLLSEIVPQLYKSSDVVVAITLANNMLSVSAAAR